jgi:hypothetical protein
MPVQEISTLAHVVFALLGVVVVNMSSKFEGCLVCPDNVSDEMGVVIKFT